MKKIRIALIFTLFLVFGVFFTACENQFVNGTLTSNKTNVVLFLEEGLDQDIVKITPQGFSPEKLNVSYDPSNITISSLKQEDGSFDLTIKTVTTLSCEPIIVEVFYQNVKTSFYVEVVLPLQSLNTTDTYIPFYGEQVSLDLSKQITFDPIKTNQTNLKYEISQEIPKDQQGNDLLEIIDSQLIVKKGFNDFSSNINIKVTSLDKQDISSSFDVAVVPNALLCANQIIVTAENNAQVGKVLKAYDLNIFKNADNFNLDTFNIQIKIPTNLNLSVDVDKFVGGDNTQNITSILEYKRLISKKTIQNTEYDVFDFIFSTEVPLQGNGILKFKYTNNIYDDLELTASFVGNGSNGQTDEFLNEINISAIMKINDIQINTQAIKDQNAYLVYKNYDKDVYGTKFVPVALPTGTIQTSLILERQNDSKLIFVDKHGKEIVFKDNKFEFLSNDEIFVKVQNDVDLNNNITEKFTVSSKANSQIIKDITVKLTEGASSLTFEDNTTEKNIYVATNHPTDTELLFNGNLSDFVGYDENTGKVVLENGKIEINKNIIANKFVISFIENQAGEFNYTISTINGFNIVAKVKVIDVLTQNDIKLDIKSEYNVAGVGQINYDKNYEKTINNISIHAGFTVELNLLNNMNAKLKEIKASYYQPEINSIYNIFDEQYQEIKNDPNNYNYDNINFTNSCSIINNNYLVNDHLISGLKPGFAVIKIDYIGQNVNNNEIVDEKVATRYMFVEIYNPAKYIESENSIFNLYAEDQVGVGSPLTTTTFKVLVKSNQSTNASYDKIFIKDGTLEQGGNVCTKTYENGSLRAEYNYSNNLLTLTALKYFEKDITVDLFASDFLNNFEDSTGISKKIIVKFKQAERVTDISISNLTLKSEEGNTKNYEEVYLDTLNEENPKFKLVLTLEPSNAFNKNLNFEVSQSLMDKISVSKDGLISYIGSNGGVGTITITSLDESYSKKIIVSVIVSDGNSFETAYKINSLSQITDANKHYILASNTTYLLQETLLNGQIFNGGLYGNKDDQKSNATIKFIAGSNSVLPGALFAQLGSNAVVKNLTIIGDAFAQGFVANSSAGTIQNVYVDTYITANSYSPSVLTAPSDAGFVGGIAGSNSGTIINCTFAGSIDLKNNQSATVGAIYGNNSGTVTDCEFICAKFEFNQTNIAKTKKTEQNGQDIYINGILNSDETFSDLNFGVTQIDYSSAISLGALFIKNSTGEEGTNQSYGEENNTNALVFYYKAKDQSKQESLDEKNTIQFSDLFDQTNNLTNNLRVVAKNLNGTTCDFVEVGSNFIKIKGIGQFVLIVSSNLDYTSTKTFNILSLYYFDNFKVLDESNSPLVDSNLSIVKDQTAKVLSTTSTKISDTLLYENDFNVVFTIKDNTQNIEILNFVTGSKLGSHTINTKGLWTAELTELSLTSKISTGILAFDNLLAKYCQEVTFKISKKNGTIAINSNISEAIIEPKDTLAFEVVLDTDMSCDEAFVESIKNENNFDCTEKFNIEINKDTQNANKYTINISLKDESKSSLDLINKVYIITIKSQTSDESCIYDCKTTIKLKILPQTISSINTSMYKTTRSTYGQILANTKDQPTSVIKPSDSGLLVIDMFPNYASYDYLEITATSNTLSKLIFRPQKLINDNYYNNDDTNNYQALSDVNGIRLFNKYSTNASDLQNIGSYFVKVFADSNFDKDTIFTLTVNAYLNGNKLQATKVFTLFVKSPQKPEFTINGQTKIFEVVGKTIETQEIFIADNQINPSVQIIALDGKSTQNILTSLTALGNNEDLNQVRYKLIISYNTSYNPEKDSTIFEIKLESTYQEKGEQVVVSSTVQVYGVDFIPQANLVQINQVVNGNINITSLTPVNIYQIISNYINNINANNVKINNALKENPYEKLTNYLYYDNIDTNFSFGKKTLEYYGKNKNEDNNIAMYRLIDCLYYVNGNEITPISKFNDDTNYGEFYENALLEFYIKNDKLYVVGGSTTGTANLRLEIPYTYPDGSIRYYSYDFTISNSTYTTEDFPIEIKNSKELLQIENNETAQDYILTRDLSLYNFEMIQNTDKIRSLDGNNHIINIYSYENTDLSRNTFALFKQVSQTTTIKNLTINLYYLSEISVGLSANAKIAGFAITNNGIITNCEVVAFKSDASMPSTTNGIKVDEEVNAQIAGFVIDNNGSITHSRVGGDVKSKTTIKGIDDVTIENYQLSPLSIVASGDISGFVINNTGVIASSFVKNIEINNKYNKNETKITSGFAQSNSGTITLSYVENGFSSHDKIQSDIGGIFASGEMSGFVYENVGKISDSYSNITLVNSAMQSSRMGSGFVFKNSLNATIDRSYSFSTIKAGSITQLNFAGVTVLENGGLTYNNQGQINNCYYYTTDLQDAVNIESLLNTTITAINSVYNKDYFYGFDFNDSNVANNGTWEMGKHGPQIISANEIAMSLRFKVEDTQVAQNQATDYTFVYCTGYELGTYTNPIIIRDAKEFVSVFGASNSTEIKNNYNLSNKKVYGAYRIVNNLDFSEFIPKENESSQIVSTQMTLTGEETNASKRNGSLNGNGLTISNFAISNHQITNNENFGLFKSIENNASIKNLNIELASGGVTADHTVFVGTIAGSVINSSLSNISIKANSGERTTVLGSNVVGAVAGRVIQNSIVSNISVENISVTATYYANLVKPKLDEFSSQSQNKYDSTKENGFNNLSIAGGVFGVIDISNNSEEDFIPFDNVVGIKSKGSMKIQGMTVGGLIGFTGLNVYAKDLALTITKSSTSEQAKFVSNGYVGGIVGFNQGSMVQVKIEHEESWQKQIESNIYNYYHAQEEQRQTIDRGLLDLFVDEKYEPIAIGGLVGVMDSGKISTGYSKINVINANASFAGGIVGLINKTNKTALDKSLVTKINEVYSTGDVYTKEGYLSGLIGYDLTTQNPYINSDTVEAEIAYVSILTKLTAMNYWGEDTYKRLYGKNDPKFNTILNEKTETTSRKDQAGQESQVNIRTGTSSVLYSLNSIQFEGLDSCILESYKLTQESGSIASNVFESYYNYAGTHVDNGAQIDLMFFEKSWSKTYWGRDITEMFPHLVYNRVVTNIEITNTNDFIYFIIYGNDQNVTFVVNPDDSDGESDGLIDCVNVYMSYGTVRGTIIGKKPTYGFKNLKVPLINTLQDATVSELVLESCQAGLAINSRGSTRISGISLKDFSGSLVNNIKSDTLTVSNLTFDSTEVTETVTNFGFVAQEGDGTLNASSIVFEDCRLTSSSATNIGLVFGSISNVELSDITLNSCKITAENNNQSSNIGLLGGYCGGKLTLNMSSIILNTNLEKDNIYVTLQDEKTNTKQDQKTNTVNVGGLIGSANTLVLTTETSLVNYSPKITVKSDVEYLPYNTTLQTGAVAGNVTTLNVASTTTTEQSQTTYNQIIFGMVSNNNNVAFQKYTYSLDSKENNIGGLFGNIGSMDKSSNKNTMLTFVGDIILNSQTAKTSHIANIGGIAGTTGGNLSNLYYEGTISFSEEIYSASDNTFNIGGIVGTVSNGLTISWCISSGEIIMNLKASESCLNSDEVFVGGIIGNYGSSVSGKITDSASITTIISNKSENVDAILNETSNTTSKNVTISSTYYASNLTLCTSNMGENVISNDENLTKLTSKVTGSDIEAGLSYKGSKLNPYTFTESGITDLREEDASTENASTNESFYVTSSKTSTPNSITSTLIRKVYVKVVDDLFGSNSTNSLKAILESNTGEGSLINNKIPYSLSNAIIFSDGAKIYSDKTVFNTVDNQSAISGLTVALYCTNGSENDLAGFVNQNNGIIYTCSVQECLDNTNQNATQFYGVLKNTSSNNIAGFVGTNNGRIFGSFSNVALTASEGNIASGFVSQNNGIIDTCYASGEIKFTSSSPEKSEAGKLFVGKKGSSSIENCYTIVKANWAKYGTTYISSVNDEELGISDGVTYDCLSSEVGTNETVIKSVGIMESKVPEVSSGDPEVNYGYPTLGESTQFKNIGYTNRSTIYNNGYYQLPNYRTLTNKNISNNSIIIFDIYAGIKGVIETEITVGGNTNAVSSYITTNSNTNIELWGYGHTILNITLNNGSLISTNNGTIKDLTFKDINLTNSSGVIGVNEGTISDCTVDGELIIKQVSTTSAAIGGLVGSNSGNVVDCKCFAQISDEGTISTAFTFGGLVGSNNKKGSIYGTEENDGQSGSGVTLFQGNIQFNLTDTTGDISGDKSVDLVVGGIAGENSGTIKTVRIEPLTAKINDRLDGDYTTATGEAGIDVQSGGNLYVGGVAGKSCGTVKNCLFVGKTGTYGIIAGNETTQTKVYAGGIVGSITKDATLLDCANKANISALAKWAKIGSDDPIYRYSYETNQIVLYQNMQSLAYAGGITASNINLTASKNSSSSEQETQQQSLLQESNTEPNSQIAIEFKNFNNFNNLANYGKISGGYSGTKAVGVLSHKLSKNDKVKLNSACVIIITQVVRFFIGGPAAKVASAGWIVASMAVITDSLKKLNLTYTPVINNSGLGFNNIGGWCESKTQLSLLKNQLGDPSSWDSLFNNDTAYNKFVMKDLGFMKNAITLGSTFANVIKTMAFVLKLLPGNFNEKLDNATNLNIKSFTVIDNESSTRAEYVGILTDNFKNNINDDIKTDYLVEDIYYDTIALGLKKENDDTSFNIYSSQSRFYALTVTDGDQIPNNGITYTKYNLLLNSAKSILEEKNNIELYLGNLQKEYKDNDKLHFSVTYDSNFVRHITLNQDSPIKETNTSWNTSGGSKKDKSYNDYTYYTLDNSQGNVYEYVLYSDGLGLWDGSNTSSWIKDKDKHYVPPVGTLEKIEVKEVEGVYYYTLEDPNKWEALVNTINVNNTETWNIKINLTNGTNVINVGNSTIDKFTGTIGSNNAITFKNITYKYGAESNKYVGLIGQTYGNVTLNNINILNTSTDFKGKEVVFGGLVGQVSSGTLTINNCSVSKSSQSTNSSGQKMAFINNNSYKNLTMYGGVVGQVNSGAILNINSVTVYAGNINYGFSNTQNTSLSSFSEFVGENQGTINLDNINLTGKSNLAADFANYGSVVGKNQGALTVNNATIKYSLIATGINKKNNISVGGIVGYNNSSITLKNSNITKSLSSEVFVSADSQVSNSQVYAGGIIGYNDNSNNNGTLSIENTTIGKKDSKLNEVCYILAGYNEGLKTYNDLNIVFTKASAGKIYGNSDATLETGLSLYNTFAKGISSEDEDMFKNVADISTLYNPDKSDEGWTETSDLSYRHYLVDDSGSNLKGEIVLLYELTNEGKYATWDKDPLNYETYIIYDTMPTDLTKKIPEGYKFVEIIDQKGTSDDDSDDISYGWHLARETWREIKTDGKVYFNTIENPLITYNDFTENNKDNLFIGVTKNYYVFNNDNKFMHISELKGYSEGNYDNSEFASYITFGSDPEKNLDKYIPEGYKFVEIIDQNGTPGNTSDDTSYGWHLARETWREIKTDGKVYFNTTENPLITYNDFTDVNKANLFIGVVSDYEIASKSYTNGEGYTLTFKTDETNGNCDLYFNSQYSFIGNGNRWKDVEFPSQSIVTTQQISSQTKKGIVQTTAYSNFEFEEVISEAKYIITSKINLQFKLRLTKLNPKLNDNNLYSIELIQTYYAKSEKGSNIFQIDDVDVEEQMSNEIYSSVQYLNEGRKIEIPADKILAFDQEFTSIDMLYNNAVFSGITIKVNNNKLKISLNFVDDSGIVSILLFKDITISNGCTETNANGELFVYNTQVKVDQSEIVNNADLTNTLTTYTKTLLENDNINIQPKIVYDGQSYIGYRYSEASVKETSEESRNYKILSLIKEIDDDLITVNEIYFEEYNSNLYKVGESVYSIKKSVMFGDDNKVRPIEGNAIPRYDSLLPQAIESLSKYSLEYVSDDPSSSLVEMITSLEISNYYVNSTYNFTSGDIFCNLSVTTLSETFDLAKGTLTEKQDPVKNVEDYVLTINELCNDTTIIKELINTSIVTFNGESLQIDNSLPIYDFIKDLQDLSVYASSNTGDNVVYKVKYTKDSTVCYDYYLPLANGDYKVYENQGDSFNILKFDSMKQNQQN